MAPGLRLEKITPDNVRAACLLELRPGQDGLVAPVAWSLADAYAAPPDLPWPRLVYDQDELVGFIMAAFDPANENDLYHCYLWRLNISGTRQGGGYGRFAVAGLCAEARRRGLRRVTVSFHAGDHGPEGFYQRLGFRRTGELNQGEVVAELLLAAGPGAGDPSSAS
jgi:diamine N-acetyltransferase